MNTIDVKEEVRRAIGREWPAFAQQHPRLAAVVDETLLLEPAMTALGDDPEFAEAMQTAAAVGAAGDVIATIVSRVVNKWLQQLI